MCTPGLWKGWDVHHGDHMWGGMCTPSVMHPMGYVCHGLYSGWDIHPRAYAYMGQDIHLREHVWDVHP